MTCFNNMNATTIKLTDFVSCNKGITPDDGEPIYRKVLESLKNNTSVNLDFAGVEMMTTAFLNVVIGNLYKDFSSEQLKSMLNFSNLPQSIGVRIKKVTDNAKLFYKDEESFNKVVEKVINGNS